MADQPRRYSDSASQISKADSQTAQEYIASQLALEAEAREALPYQFDTCTRPLGPLRQSLFSCLTCNPPPTSQRESYTPAGLCYSCSISCHGEHNLVELFTKRNFVCDCGTTRIANSAPCTLRSNEATGSKGVKNEEARNGNNYDHNYAGHFCGCGETYDPSKEKGTMFQCLGLGTVEDGGCGEDWWHPECLLGLPRQPHGSIVKKEEPAASGALKQEGADNSLAAIPEDPQDAAATEIAQEPNEVPLPQGFPAEDDFDHFICYKCVEANPWIKQYAGTTGFQGVVFKQATEDVAPASQSAKRKADDQDENATAVKRTKVEAETLNEFSPVKSDPAETSVADAAKDKAKHEFLPTAPNGSFSLFLKEDFRDHFCRCPECFPRLAKHPQLLEEEEAYEPPVSESDAEDANGGGSVGTGSILERGEAALSTMDRMKAIEGVMAYNHLKDKVKTFLQPFAESGQAVGAEDVKAYFAKLRGDEEAMRLAAASAGSGGVDSDNRREQGGY